MFQEEGKTSGFAFFRASAKKDGRLLITTAPSARQEVNIGAYRMRFGVPDLPTRPVGLVGRPGIPTGVPRDARRLGRILLLFSLIAKKVGLDC